jgi:hypothetical protein
MFVSMRIYDMIMIYVVVFELRSQYTCMVSWHVNLDRDGLFVLHFFGALTWVDSTGRQLIGIPRVQATAVYISLSLVSLSTCHTKLCQIMHPYYLCYVCVQLA